ncbi:MAG: sodium:proton antiporter [Cyanobacteria bacterium HKST-UBA03]|nr:sodium:proton antiporter [Cyanobacteria bacterium HKST-UBA03]
MNHYFVGLAFLLFMGMAAQWLSWRLKVPSILLLLLGGFFSGAVLGVVRPDELLGDQLRMVVSLAVGIILFEGGLTLKLEELKSGPKVIRNLLSLGVMVTWLLSTWLAHVVLGLAWPLSLLTGAILIVTGPTVMGPMLRFIRPLNELNHILKWEGILNDPIGAVVAVLTLESILMGNVWAGGVWMLWGIVKTLVVASLIGAIFAIWLVLIIRRNWAPEMMHNAMVLAMVMGAYALSNVMQHESGLLATTVMGIVLANQKVVSISAIVEFKKTLQVFFISTLFILLSARLTLADLSQLGWNSVLYALLLIVLVRPAAVWVSTIGSGLNWREKLFISMMAPRGIVAAAVASVASFILVERGINEAAILTPLIFLVIAVTILFYGLFSPGLARWLNLVKPPDSGVLILGAHDWAITLAKHISAQGQAVLLADTDRGNLYRARMAGLKATYSSIFSPVLVDVDQLQGIGKLLALTPNDEVNSLGALRFSEYFGRQQTYQLLPDDVAFEAHEQDVYHRPFSGRSVFMDGITFKSFTKRFANGAELERLRVVEAFALADINHELHLPLLAWCDGELTILSADDNDLVLKPGDVLLLLTNDLPLLLRLSYMELMTADEDGLGGDALQEIGVAPGTGKVS